MPSRVLVSCGRCGCALTAEIKKGRYVYYHCTGGRGACGNTYVREEELSRLFAEVVKRVQVPVHAADLIAEALRDSQDDKERFHRTAVMARTGAFAENAGIELDLRPRKPCSCLR
jgi:site-specific DNA recombinase